VPVPLVATQPRSSAPQSGQAGPGGNRFTPHALHTWIRSSPSAVPSQKAWESRFIIGRTTYGLVSPVPVVINAPWGRT
jgi:hypothetical protein